MSSQWKGGGLAFFAGVCFSRSILGRAYICAHESECHFFVFTYTTAFTERLKDPLLVLWTQKGI